MEAAVETDARSLQAGAAASVTIGAAVTLPSRRSWGWTRTSIALTVKVSGLVLGESVAGIVTAAGEAIVRLTRHLTLGLGNRRGCL